VLPHCHVYHRAIEPPDVGSTKKEQNECFQEQIYITQKRSGYKEQRQIERLKADMKTVKFIKAHLL
jgi:hypothetical protein